MSTFDQPTPTKSIPAAAVGNTPSGTYYVPDSHLTPLQRNQRGIDAVLKKIETNLETLRMLINEQLHLTHDR